MIRKALRTSLEWFSVLALGAVASAASPAADGGDPAGVSATDWAGIREARAAALHAVVPEGDGFRARNAAQRWTSVFEAGGVAVHPDAQGWTWGLELREYGFEGSTRSVEQPAGARAEGRRLVYRWDADLEEWYVNHDRGLEHGFTLHRRPTGEGGALCFSIAVRGDLRTAVDADGRGARFLDDGGAAALTYSNLVVFDADGRDLPARLEPTEAGIRIAVDERGATYPITVDPIAQQVFLKASNTDAYDEFGKYVAVSGDTVVVGAPSEGGGADGVNGDDSDNSAWSAGAAYVFVRDNGTWSQQAYLKAGHSDPIDYFGTTLAIEGDRLVVGAPGDASSATGVNGDPLDNGASQSGAAYVFERSGTTWTQTAYLKASNTGANDRFGEGVALSGDTIVVGAPDERSSATGVDGNQADDSIAYCGSSYVFVHDGSSWSQQAYLKASNTGEYDYFGSWVSVSGDTLVVGAPGEGSADDGVGADQNDDTAAHSGAAYVFVRNGSTWSQQAYIKASNSDPYDTFGFTVSISGDTLVVGAPGEESSSAGIDGDQDDNSLLNAGAAYVFVRNGTTWSQEAYIKPSNPDTYDSFAASVCVSGDIFVAGAPGEGSDATGVNGDDANNDSLYSGAAYVYRREGTKWTQMAYLKASNTGTYDSFCSVGMEGDLVAVGAPGERSSSTGVGGDQSGNTLKDAGAAYVFEIFEDCNGNGTSDAEEIASGAELDCNQNGVPDSCDIATAASTDGNCNGVPDDCEGPLSLTGSPCAVSVGSGGAQAISLAAGPAHAFQLYLLLGSASGSSPGLVIEGFPLPLNFPDAYFQYTLTNPNSPVLPGSVGLLGNQGEAATSFVLPAGLLSPSAAGLVLNHAFFAITSVPVPGITFVSNAASVTLAP